ncbi:succinate dehydrogenase, cytochrome b556 subunit [Tropicimonas sp. IMCC34043]|uniref:succinate dehydrogenase, cytochrome b556 subunit n=1 Tax=Tropicimonas sp. IMCC34043 TaxID=2248760 RepID=UPI000E27B090|nr:succinate dehydrogenase, cytochrome b556 subunit [Tropicimonas sp. IMCC34043]
MADVNQGNRPLSPHLQIYRTHILMVSSILIRITGNGLTVGIVLVLWWLLAAAAGPEAYAANMEWLTGWWLAYIVWFGLIWALSYHMLGGIRHIIWDEAVGLDLKTAEKLGWAIVIGSGALAVVISIFMLIL